MSNLSYYSVLDSVDMFAQVCGHEVVLHIAAFNY